MSGADRNSSPIIVGVLSDTHGHLYPRVKEMLEGVDHIIHAGDIGSEEVLTGLKAIAPVTAVRGNCDLEAWARSLPAQAEVELGGVRILVGHIASRLQERLRPAMARLMGRGLSPKADGENLRVVVSGHSHRMESKELDGILHLNPGSAGPKRFGRPRTLARLTIVPADEDEGLVGEDSRARIRVELFAVDEGN